MARLSISFTEPNDNWVKSQIENKEYSSKSELVNDLISWKLERAKKIGFTSNSKEQILAQ